MRWSPDGARRARSAAMTGLGAVINAGLPALYCSR
jgi:hypothetical protein